MRLSREELMQETLAEYQERCRANASDALDGAGFVAFLLAGAAAGDPAIAQLRWKQRFGESLEDTLQDPANVARRFAASFHRAQFEAAIRAVSRRQGPLSMLRAGLWRARVRLALEQRAAEWLATEMPLLGDPLPDMLRSRARAERRR